MFAKKEMSVKPQEKRGWAGKKKESPQKEKREPFYREYVRDLKYGNGDSDTFVWVFSEYRKPEESAPHFRLHEEKFIMDGRDRRPMLPCRVASELDMRVRAEAYAEFLMHIGR